MTAPCTHLANTTRRIAVAQDSHVDPPTAAVRRVLAVAELPTGPHAPPGAATTSMPCVESASLGQAATGPGGVPA